MEALERESFEFRAHFFGRTIEEELVGCLGGSRSNEAMSQLQIIASRRSTTIQTLIEHQERMRGRQCNQSVCIAEPRKTTPCENMQKPPSIIFEASECPVCQDDDCLLHVMTCGHKICKICFDEMSTHHQLVDFESRVKCPNCRTPCQKLWTMDEVNQVGTQASSENESKEFEEKTKKKKENLGSFFSKLRKLFAYSR